MALSIVPPTGINWVENHESRDMCFSAVESKRPGLDYDVLMRVLPQAIARELELRATLQNFRYCCRAPSRKETEIEIKRKFFRTA